MTTAHSTRVFCLCWLLLLGVTALQMSPTPGDGDVLCAESATDVTMAWKFTLSPGDVTQSITWNFHGQVQTMVAFFTLGNFIPLSPFVRRLSFVPNGGITLRKVTKTDAGNYSITIIGHDASGTNFVIQRTIRLQVFDPPVTDQELRASLLPVAEWSAISQQFQAVLSCGVFTSTTAPPVSVQWLTPDGRTVPSTRYSQGQFQLLLQNPVTAGTYKCSLAPGSANVTCSQAQPPSASVKVSGLQTRLILVEAMIGQLTSTQHQLQRENAEMKSKWQTLDTKYQALKYRAETTIAFSARLSKGSVIPTNAPLILDDVEVNLGEAYSSYTGKFVAPLNGTYFFTAFTTAWFGSHSVFLSVRSGTVANNREVFHANAYTNISFHQSCAVQGALHLEAGEEVWIQTFPSSTYNYFSPGSSTAFSGFLVSVD